MKKKIFSVLFALVLAVSLMLVPAVVSADPILTVDDDWQTGVTPEPEDIDGDNDFATIQAAINAANPSDTINVAAGIYKETIDVNVDGLTIQSLSGDPSDTIIDANGADHTVVTIRSSNVILSGFTITGSIGLTYADWSYQGNSGVFMRVVSGCHLFNLIIDDIRRETPGHGNGIFLQGSCDNIFESIAISNIAGGAGGGMINGILFRGDVGGSSNNSFTDITIDTITLENANPNFGATGIILWGFGNDDNTFDTLEISNVAAPQAAIGIRTGVSERNSFTSTEISSLTSPKAYGILLEDSVNDIFEGTTIWNIAGGSGRARGIYLIYSGCHHNSFTSTDISGLTGAVTHGIFAYGGAHDNSFNGGSILGAKHGVFIMGSCLSNSIHYTNIVGNTEYGAYSDTVTLDATNNWWGDCSGPSGGVADPVTGTPANGTGDSVSANVLFDPWWCSSVQIDIKPGSDLNSINLKSKGLIPVAILGSATFDVTTVDVTTLDFEGASPAHDLTDPDTYDEHLQYVNDDEYLDLVSHHKTQETNLTEISAEATLTGATNLGLPIEGTDSVNIVGKGR